MTGLSRSEIKYRFGVAELKLQHEDWDVCNPIRVWAFRFPWLYRAMELCLGKQRAYDLVLLYDLWLVRKCDRLHLIGGDWMSSPGALAEMAFAKAMKIEVTIEMNTSRTRRIV